MKALVFVLVVSGVAHAGLIKPPQGWVGDADAAKQLAEKANAEEHFGGAKALATTEVYLAPKPGVALFVTAVAGSVTTEHDAAARVAIDELHATAQRAALLGSGIGEDGWQEKIAPAAKQVEATLSWHDGGAGTRSQARILVVADRQAMVAITGECVAAADADAGLIKACAAALATLDPGIDPKQRIAIALAPTGARPQAQTASRPAPQLEEAATKKPGLMMPVPQEDHSTDRRPVYVGAGIVVLAAALWWRQRRRARQGVQ